MDIFYILFILLILGIHFLAVWNLGGANFHKLARYKQVWSPLLVFLIFGVGLYFYFSDYYNYLREPAEILQEIFAPDQNIVKPLMTLMWFVGVTFVAAIAKTFLHTIIFSKGKYKTNDWEKLSKLDGKKAPDFIYYLHRNRFICLIPRWEFVRHFFKWTAWVTGATVVLSVIFIAYLNGYEPFAFVAFIMAMEFFWLFNGPSTEASQGGVDIKVDLPQIKKSVDFYNLWEEYQQIWDNKFLAAWHYKGRNATPTPGAAITDNPLLKQFNLSGTQAEIYEHFEKGKDIIIPSARYRELMPVLFSGLLRRVLNGENILVLTPRVTYATSVYHSEVEAWLQSGLSMLSGNEVYWKTQIYDHKTRGQLYGDIIVSSADDLLEHDALKNDWFDELTTILYVFADDTMAADPTNNTIAAKMLKDRHGDLQFVMLGQNRSYFQDSVKRNFELGIDLIYLPSG